MNSLPICLTIFSLIVISLIVILIIMRLTVKSSNKSLDAMMSTMVVLGSGGHTSEMLTLISQLRLGSNHKKYSPITFIASKDDVLSQEKVQQKYKSLTDYNLIQIRRSRSVGQNYLSSIVTTIMSIIDCIIICYKVRPQLVLCNGPGVCIPICFAAKLVSRSVVIVFVESFCRTESLSLSAKIVYYLRICDHCLVQWPQLKDRYHRTQYIGLLV